MSSPKDKKQQVKEVMVENTIEKSAQALKEEAVLAFWQNEEIFQKSLAKDSPKGEFVFYDGPPFATGSPHYGHILASTIKDVVPRYKTMQGFHVSRRWGWDCHGLPVENLVEKELGLTSKKDIEQYGLQKFTDVARDFVLRYTDIWREQIPRFGRWVDMDNDYRTMDPTYTESVWWVFKTLYDKGLINEGFKSMHLCPRCGTTLSNFEVNQGYKDITDISVYVGFKVTLPKEIISTYEGEVAGDKKDKGKKIDLANTYLVGWTTTPWTLPGNVALAVIENGVYRKYKLIKRDESGKEITENPVYYIHLGDRIDNLKKLLKGELEEVAVMYGKDLAGLSYEPVFPYYAKSATNSDSDSGASFAFTKDQLKNAYKVYTADFVTTTDGTGIVHIAPAFGSDDYTLLKKHDLPFVQHVAVDGTFKPEVTDFAIMKVKAKDGTVKDQAGKEVKDAHQLADIEIIKYLASKGTLVAKEKITHSYPHCWRCETPLINYASSSWFVDVPSFADKLVEENKNIKWVPKEVGEFRFGNWLAGAREWAISRSRYWGAPIPVWKSEDGREMKVIANREELRKEIKASISGSGSAKNNFYVVRHGEAAHNVAHIMSTNPNNKHALTERGKTQVRKTAEMLLNKNIDVIYTSPFYRTEETAKYIADNIFAMNKNASGENVAKNNKKIEIIKDVRLSEINAGAFDGKTVAEYRASFGPHDDRFHVSPSGAENYTELRKRVMNFIYEINKKHSGKNVLIVTHDSLAWMLVSGSLGLTNPEAVVLRGTTEFFLDNAEVKEVDFVELPHNENYEIDMHRPYIDQVTLLDSRGKKMNRVKDVFDCWFESGSMPYGEATYKGQALPHFDPMSGSNNIVSKLATKIFGNKLGGVFGAKKDGIGFPADFIAEGLDQTRGWFYSMLVLGVALFGKSPFKNVIVNGLVLAEDGKKMSKSLKNYPDPMLIVNKYSMDAVRFFMLSSSAVASEDVCFTEKGVDEAMKKVINRLDNVVTFYETYANAEIAGGSKLNLSAKSGTKSVASSHVLDEWVLYRLNETIEGVTKALDAYQLNVATRPIYDFIEDLSVWYIRRSRDRFKASDTEEEKQDQIQALRTTKFVLVELSKLVAPFMPFLAEDIYGRITKVKEGSIQTELVIDGYKESVHLENWPKVSGVSGASDHTSASAKSTENDVLKNMSDVRKVVTLGLEARTTAKIKVRQPLASVTVSKDFKAVAEQTKYASLIKDELNVKEVKFDAGLTEPLTLDTVITTELKEEGFIREVVRMIQDARKTAGLLVGDRVSVTISTNEEGKRIISANQKNVEKSAQLEKISFAQINEAVSAEIPKIDGVPVKIVL